MFRNRIKLCKHCMILTEQYSKGSVKPIQGKQNLPPFSLLSSIFSFFLLHQTPLSLSLCQPISMASNSVQPLGEEEISNENVLAKHVAFFDINKDGIVYPWETFRGFREIGCGLPLSIAAGFIINMGLSQKTRPGKFPSLLFPIEIKNIALAKHGSDSGVYDTEGRFVPSKFEEIFSKNAHTNPDALTGDELKKMIKSNRQPKDYAGWFASYIEWIILYDLCKDKAGLLHRDKIRGVYDGSLFEQMKKEHESTRKKS